MSAAHSDDRQPAPRAERARSTRHDDRLVARNGERRGNPVRIRDGPAAVRGDAPAPRRHWPRAGKAAEGEPRVRRPAARRAPEPLAEGGFVLRRPVAALVAALAGASLLAAPARRRARAHSRRGQDADDLRRRPSRASTPRTRSRRSSARAPRASSTTTYADASSARTSTRSAATRPRARPAGSSRSTGLAAGRRRQRRAEDGDDVLWYWAEFGRPAGRRRSRSQRGAAAAATACSARTTPAPRAAATGAVLRVDGRRVRTRAGSGRAPARAGTAGSSARRSPARFARTPCDEPCGASSPARSSSLRCALAGCGGRRRPRGRHGDALDHARSRRRACCSTATVPAGPDRHAGARPRGRRRDALRRPLRPGDRRDRGESADAAARLVLLRERHRAPTGRGRVPAARRATSPGGTSGAGPASERRRRRRRVPRAVRARLRRARCGRRRPLRRARSRGGARRSAR